jgi:hypothetical protein
MVGSVTAVGQDNSGSPLGNCGQRRECAARTMGPPAPAIHHSIEISLS